MKKFYSLFLLAAMLLPLKMSAQLLYSSYDFTTGVGAEKWITLSDSAQSVNISGDDAASSLLNIGFTFRLCGVDHTQWSINTNGRIRLGSTVITNDWNTPFASAHINKNLPLIAFHGSDQQFYNSNYAKYQVVGDSGSRVLVVEVRSSVRNQQSVTEDIQVQFAEADQSITLVYGARTGMPNSSYQIGIASSTTDVALVDVAHNTVDFLEGASSTTNASNTWPELNRWYKFTYNPSACVFPANLQVAENTTSSTTISWDPSTTATSYSVNLSDSLHFTTTDTFYTFMGLAPSSSFSVSVRSLCSDDDSSRASTVGFVTPCGVITSQFLPYYQDFETFTSYANFPSCLARLNYGTGNYPTNLLGTDWAATSHEMVYFMPTAPGNEQFVILPEFENVTDLRVHFWTKRGANSVWIDVGVMDGTTDSSSFEVLATVGSVAGSSDWSDFVIPLSGYTGTGSNIAFRARNTITANSYILIDDITVDYNTGCWRPDSISVTDIASNNATLHIYPAASVSSPAYQVVLVSPTLRDTISTTDTAVSISGLTPGTVYDLYVSTICGTDVTPYVRHTFTTECGMLSLADLPFVENFDSYAYNANAVINPCYHRLSFNPDPNYAVGPYPKNQYQRVNGVGNTLYFYPGPGEQSQYFILPEMADVQELMIDFWVQRPNTNMIIEVGIMTDPDSAATFVPIQTCNPSAINTWQEFDISFLGYEGEGNFIAIRARNNGSSANYVVIDDIVVKEDLCPKPYNLHLASFENGEAVLEWNGAPDVTAYEIMVGTDLDTVYSASFTIQNATPLTDYPVVIRSLCSGDSSNYLIAVIQTPLDSLPYFQDFNSLSGSSANTMPTGWSKIGLGNVDYSTSYTVDGTVALRYYGATSDNIVVLPTFPREISELYIDFWTRPESTNSSCGQFDVGYVTDVTDASSFVAVATYAYSDFPNAAYGERYETFFGAPAGARMALRHRSGATNYYWFVDNVEVGVSTCPGVGALAVSDISAHGATVSWPDMGSGTTYLLSVDGGELQSLTDTSFTATGLSAGQQHTITVARICDNGDTTRNASTRFITECDLLTHSQLPYLEDFETYATGTGQPISPCWTINNFSNTYPYPSTSTGYTGASTHLLYCFPNNNAPHYIALPPVDYLSDLVLTFRTRTGIVNKVYDVGVMTDVSDTNSFVLVQSCVATSGSNWESWEVPLLTYSGTGNRVVIRARLSSNNNSYFYLDDVSLSVAASCMPPQGINVSNVAENSALLTIHDASQVGNYRVIVSGSAVSDTIATTDTVVTLANLVPSTDYIVLVNSICSDSTTTTAVAASFSTPCGAVSLPWFEDFDSYPNNNVSDLSDCWGLYSDARYDNVVAGTASLGARNNNNKFLRQNEGFTGTKHFVHNVYSSNLFLWLVTPVIRLDTTASLSFDLALNRWAQTVAPNGDLADDRFIVAVTTDNGTTWTPLAMWGSDTTRDDYSYAAISSTRDSITFSLAQFTGQSVRIAFYGESVVSGDDNSLRIDNIHVYASEAVSDTTVTPPAPTVFSVSVATADAVMGSATVSPSGLVNEGTQVTFTATSNNGYHFVNWTDAAGQPYSTDSVLVVTVTGNLTLTANFEANAVVPPTPTTYTVTLLTASSTMGSVSPAGATTVNENSSFTATATANEGYHFVAWMDGGNAVSTQSLYTFTVTSDVTLTATFDADVVEPTCEAPTNVTVGNVTENSAVVGWTAGGTESSWEVEYNGATTTVTTNPATLNGLTPSTDYVVRVRAVCANGQSQWSSYASFRTLDVQQPEGIDDV
ncbi:MAG: fibronectin type III domain-containing protein, partial [Bacteroidales bacterium]|nr:fibronectin type III domain-containing protein [Bacteroidales bacterium]